jgi:hypothetical protein
MESSIYVKLFAEGVASIPEPARRSDFGCATYLPLNVLYRRDPKSAAKAHHDPLVSDHDDSISTTKYDDPKRNKRKVLALRLCRNDRLNLLASPQVVLGIATEFVSDRHGPPCFNSG